LVQAWFLLALAPVANVVPSGVMVAERTLYMPSAGLCFLGAAALAHLAEAGPVRSRMATATGWTRGGRRIRFRHGDRALAG
jgi:hypothetical protein